MSDLAAMILGGLGGIVVGCVLVIAYHWIREGQWPL